MHYIRDLILGNSKYLHNHKINYYLKDLKKEISERRSKTNEIQLMAYQYRGSIPSDLRKHVNLTTHCQWIIALVS